MARQDPDNPNQSQWTLLLSSRRVSPSQRHWQVSQPPSHKATIQGGTASGLQDLCAACFVLVGSTGTSLCDARSAIPAHNPQAAPKHPVIGRVGWSQRGVLLAKDCQRPRRGLGSWAKVLQSPAAWPFSKTPEISSAAALPPVPPSLSSPDPQHGKSTKAIFLFLTAPPTFFGDKHTGTVLTGGMFLAESTPSRTFPARNPPPPCQAQ